VGTVIDLTKATNAGKNAGIMPKASFTRGGQTLWLGDELVSVLANEIALVTPALPRDQRASSALLIAAP
jgi:hypothetical protein